MSQNLYETCDPYDNKNFNDICKNLLKKIADLIISVSDVVKIKNILFKSQNRMYEIHQLIDKTQLLIINNKIDHICSDILQRLFCGDVSYESDTPISQSNGFVCSTLNEF